MNLRAIAQPFTNRVNPDVVGSVYLSTGSTSAPTGKRTPTFDQVDGVGMQVQSLTGGELQRLDSLNIQGVKRAVYVNGQLDGVRRLKGQGGDMLAFGGSYWLVETVLEPWDAAGWCKVAVTEQVNAPGDGA